MVLVLLLVVYLRIPEENNIPQPLYGQPVIYCDTNGINEISIDQMVNDTQYLYILDRHDGVVCVYNLDGVYQYTMMFLDYMNGSFHIAVNQNGFYIRDPKGDVYCYQNGELTAFLPRKDANANLSEVNFLSSSDEFLFRNHGVYRRVGEKEICIIERDIISAKYPVVFRWTFAVLVVGVIGLIRFKRSRY
jgi:hypothetical protein